ncbi:glycerol acyltransferase [Psychromonas sp. psych-6C06]|uniref:alpha/beta fold hydrolase n=1 Tax=Psychromonas sp. psych-6C06 TaxID=2058089 RepID=UPI000C343BF1|nr:alpha/beta fold hydrolase [Psychromonas sp. psych-6C06]PKF60830.1 glycerol acyltransferase [Psychromonas sp. psych-6C06]
MPEEETLAKANRSFRFAGLIVSAIKKLSRSAVSVEGTEKLRANPTLFVVNHFTRFETGLLLHILYKHNGQMAHSLADSNLFKGKLGRYLESVGAHPVDLPGRDAKIISELMKGSHNWVIFPEGSMIKNKKVMHDGRLQLQLENRISAPHTGASILALKSYFLKEQYRRAIASNNVQQINQFHETYSLHGPADLATLDLCIVPVNITYYPLRPGKNLLSTGVQLLVKDLEPKLEEELLVEGKLLLQESDISISFGNPIDVRSFTKPYRRFFSVVLPFLSASRKMDWMMKLMRHRLTSKFMQRVYTRLSINMDHIVATALRYIPMPGIAEKNFKEIVYLACLSIKKQNHRHVHWSIRDSIINMVSDADYAPYESIMKLASDESILLRQDGMLLVNHERIQTPSPFHRMRLDNTTSVLANEFEVMKQGVKIIKTLVKVPPKRLVSKVASAVIERDISIFEQERMRSYIEGETKSREVGKPQHFAGKNGKKGIVLVHGFLASPGELMQLANHLHQQGYGVYIVRLAGHGTHASELQTVKLQCWLESVKRGYAVLSHYHDKVILAGFSAGALLALMEASLDLPKLIGVIAINPALRLCQKTSKLSPMLERWNRLLEGVSLEAGKLPYVENQPQYPETNYDKIYVAGLSQLLALQGQCRERLAQVNIPLLIIQSEQDPVVERSSANDIFTNVASIYKSLELLPFQHHVIVRDEGSKETFQLIDQFVASL